MQGLQEARPTRNVNTRVPNTTAGTEMCVGAFPEGQGPTQLMGSEDQQGPWEDPDPGSPHSSRCVLHPEARGLSSRCGDTGYRPLQDAELTDGELTGKLIYSKGC